jgi:hypothetical protein
MMTNKFLVIDWEWIEDSLDDKEIETFYGLLEKASFDKPEYKYIVVNTAEPYAEKVQTVVNNGRRARGMLKSEILATLQELTEADPELAHAEADEALLQYINDKDIEKAFEEVPRWYA